MKRRVRIVLPTFEEIEREYVEAMRKVAARQDSPRSKG